MQGSARYRVTCRPKLLRQRLLQWNHEVGVIFRRLEATEASITTLQERDRAGGLLDGELGSFEGFFPCIILS